jgi:protein-L-isoaspartate(D-aspartate) O-methyltransferase
MPRDAMADTDIRRMLDDIAMEVRLTRDLIGKARLDERVMAAMAAVPRHRFVPETLAERAYDDGPLPVGHGQTISQPYIVALMTDLLAVGPDDTVLEVGTGTGYQSAVLSRLVRRVYSVEIVEPLALTARERLHALGCDNVEVRIGDGYHGWVEHAPYDGIIVTAAAREVPPPLEAQLKPGARLVIPVGGAMFGQELLVLEKREDGTLDRRSVLGVAFVPLTREVNERE